MNGDQIRQSIGRAAETAACRDEIARRVREGLARERAERDRAATAARYGTETRA